jgi:hypothetical protein
MEVPQKYDILPRFLSHPIIYVGSVKLPRSMPIDVFLDVDDVDG